MREKGLEPSRQKAQEPKSCVSASFTTPEGRTECTDEHEHEHEHEHEEAAAWAQRSSRGTCGEYRGT